MACDDAFLSATERRRNELPIFYWNWVALELNRIATSLRGPQGGPTLGSRALGLIHLAIHDAWFAVRGAAASAGYSGIARPAGANDAGAAMAGAASRMIETLYGAPSADMSSADAERLAAQVRTFVDCGVGPGVPVTDSFQFGRDVADAVAHMLAIAPTDRAAGQAGYAPRRGRFRFFDEPTHPVRLVPVDPDRPNGPQRPVRIYLGPFYGTVPSFAVAAPASLALRPPPDVANGSRDAPTPDYHPAYLGALDEVVRLGGAPTLRTTTRDAAQTVAGYFWAYDGSNLIGTPPGLYNQIVREIADGRKVIGATLPPVSGTDPQDGLVAVFALVNAAMADAGKFAWREKYRFEFWRPLTGVREHQTIQGGAVTDAGALPLIADADPFWLTLGAPDTNSNRRSFKPPFPAYPSGHATFGAACFQMLRLIYGGAALADSAQPDTLSFTLVSDELNGVSRDLDMPYDPDRAITDQPGVVRTRIERTFASMKDAIFENAISRIFLGVHWNFDAFDAGLRTRPDPAGKGDDVPVPPGEVDYRVPADGQPGPDTMIGGVPLGIAIANQIFASGLVPPATEGPKPVRPAPSGAAPRVSLESNARF